MQADITVQYLGVNKKNEKYGYIKSAEGDNYGCQSEQLKQFSMGEVCTIQFHTNSRGYKEFDAKISSRFVAPLVKQNVRPATNPADSDRMATMGMVNALLSATQQSWSDLMTINPDHIANIINNVHEGLNRSVIKGKQVQRRDDLNDEIPFP